MPENKKKILIVDDDSRNIFALNAVLKSKGYNCISADSAGESFELLRNDPDIFVVLMDMMMPGIDGYEAITHIGNIRKLPVIAVTAQAMHGDREKCLEAGATAYVSKPIDIDELIKVLERC